MSKLDLFNQAEQVDDPVKAVQLYSSFVLTTPNDDSELLKCKETAIMKAAQLIKESKDANALSLFVKSLEPAWLAFPRAKTAKIIKTLLDLFEEINEEAALQVEISLCQELLDWCERDKRTFLKQSLETRLVALYHRTGMYSEALTLITRLLRDLKRLDDKMALIDVHLLESRVYFALKNIPKARAALTAARTFSNSMYTPPLTQAALDIQAGLLHAEESDYKTAYSYFIEALDNYVSSQSDPRGQRALKYMLLCKIMMGQQDDVEVLLAGKVGQYYPRGRDFDAMQAVADACKAKSLKEFETSLMTYPKELGEDPIVQSHFAALYDTLLENNLLRLITPYSRVQIAHLAASIGGLSPHDIELKLSQMILDQILPAIIDQNSGCLIVLEKQLAEPTFDLTLDCFKQMNGVVDALYVKAGKLV